MRHIKISPSLLAADFSRLGEEVAEMERAGADMLHLDVMDGAFVPNISFGLPVVAGLRSKTALFFDVHLMIRDPLAYIDAFAKAGADLITFHVESDSDVRETARRIRAHGKRAGLSLKPGTPAEAATPWLPLVDLVLVMTVEPGFGGQKFMPDQMDKLSALSAQCAAQPHAIELQVDGGIDNTTAPIAAAHGATVLVAGSALFGRPDYAAALRALRASAQPK